MRSLRKLSVMMIVLLVAAAVAAQENGNKPVGPYAALGADDSSSKPDQLDNALAPDMAPITGMQALTLGTRAASTPR